MPVEAFTFAGTPIRRVRSMYFSDSRARGLRKCEQGWEGRGKAGVDPSPTCFTRRAAARGLEVGVVAAAMAGGDCRSFSHIIMKLPMLHEM